MRAHRAPPCRSSSSAVFSPWARRLPLNEASRRLVFNSIYEDSSAESFEASAAHDSASHEFLLKLATFRPSGPLSRRSGRLARITPYSTHAYEQGATSLLSTAICELLSIEQLVYIASAFVSANHMRSTTIAVLTRIGDEIAARLNARAQILSSQEDSPAMTLDDGKSFSLVSASAAVTSFARVNLKHPSLFTAVSLWAQGAMRYKLIRPKSKSNMIWLTALLWSFSQVGFYNKWLWNEASLLFQGDPSRWFKLMDADESLKLAWAMVRVKHDSDPALMQLLLDRAATQVGKLSMEELGSAWSILADISKRSQRLPNDRLLFSLSKATRVKVNSIKPSTLSLTFTSLATLINMCPRSDEGFWRQTEGPPHSISDLLNDVAVWSSNKAFNFKPDEILSLLIAMSTIGYRNPWALKGVCRKLVMPRKLAALRTVQAPFITVLSTGQLVILLQCLSTLDHYSSSLLSRILSRLKESAEPASPSCLICIIQCLVNLRHSDAVFLADAANRLISADLDAKQRSEAAFLFAMLDTKGICTRLILGSTSLVDDRKTRLATCLMKSTTIKAWKMETKDFALTAELYDRQYMEKRMALVSSSDGGKGFNYLKLLMQDVERRLESRASKVKAKASSQDAPSISCYSFYTLDPQTRLVADIAMPAPGGKGLAILLLTELDFLRFWPGGENDPSTRPLVPMTLLRMKLINSMGWTVKTIKWNEWIESRQLRLRQE